MDSFEELHALATEYAADGWKIDPQEDGTYQAWWAHAPRCLDPGHPNPMLVLRAPTVGQLRKRICAFIRVFDATQDRAQAEREATRQT